MFLYYLFMACTLATIQDEELLAQVEQEIHERRVAIIVYGDDHVIVTTALTDSLLGARAFARWVSNVWGMTIRKIRERIPFSFHRT